MAIEKIQAEMDASKTNSYIQAVGGYLLNHLKTSPGSAEKILAEGKTIAKSLDEMRKVAEKQKDGNCAVLTDAEGFAVVLEYFGIDATHSAKSAATSPEKVALPFDIKLDDLL